MAIIPESQYPGKITPASTEYPYGQARNITLPGDGTGTPWEAALVNDLFGFQQALLSEASITPTGNPEKVGASQYLRSLQNLAPLRYATDVSYKVGEYAITSTAVYRSITAPNLGNDPDTDDGTNWEKAPTRAEIDKRTVYVGSVAEGFALASASGNRVFDVTGWASGSDVGGGIFYYDSARSKSDHDGGTIISPTVPAVSLQSGASFVARRDNFIAATGETDPTGSGVFVRRDQSTLSLYDFGGVVDGVADDSNPLKKLMTFKTIKVIPGTSKFDRSITGTMDHYGVLTGYGMDESKLIRTGGSGTCFNRRAGSVLSECTIDLGGIVGIGVSFASGPSSSRCSDYFARVEGAEASGWQALNFEADGGAFFNSFGCIYGTDAPPGTAAAVKVSGVDSQAVPRSFYAVNGGGCTVFDFGGCSDFFVNGGYSNGLLFSSNSGNKAFISNFRIGADGGTVTIHGVQHQFENSVFAVPVILAADTVGCSLGNSEVSGNDVTDNGSGNRFQLKTGYTVNWTGTTTNPAIGDGKITGIVNRENRLNSVTLRLNIGSTTALGAGQWEFSLPYPDDEFHPATGTAYILDSSTSQRTVGVVRVMQGQQRVRVYFTGSATSSGPASPIAWDTGDEMIISISYSS